MKKNNNNTYYLNQHSCFLLQYHLVLVTKYRKPVITNDLEKFLINYTNILRKIINIYKIFSL